jgi:hypothetical protein
MRGLPFHATDDEIYGFLEGLSYKLGTLKHKIDESGRRSGQAAILVAS